MKRPQPKDRWGNYLFPSNEKDENGFVITTKAIPYKSIQSSLQWLIGITNPKESDVLYFNVLASCAEEAARMGHEAFLRFVEDRPALRELRKTFRRVINEAAPCPESNS